MSTSFDRDARRFHAALPSLLRAALLDLGLSNAVIERRALGFDGRFLTVPVVDPSGVAFLIERWVLTRRDVVRVQPLGATELFGWDTLRRAQGRVVFAEGTLEALVLESHGIDAVAATGTGLFFKARAWSPAFSRARHVVVALRRGDRAPRRKGQLRRSELRQRIVETLPHAEALAWPQETGRGGGARAFFVRRGKARGDFERLLS